MTGSRLALLALLPVLALAPLVALVRYLWSILANPAKAWRIAIGFDQLVNVAANGHEDETISSRAARARDGGRRWGCLLCRLLDALDPGHCDKSRGTHRPPVLAGVD